jgi:hypothetical protein
VARVTDIQVRAVTGDPSTVDATLAIATASVFTDDQLGSSSLSESMLTQIELYLAAHFLRLQQREGTLSAQTIGDVSERYQNIYGQGLKATQFGQQAILLDTTGTLGILAANAEKPNKQKAQLSVVSTLEPSDLDYYW